MDDKKARLEHANTLIQLIASHGRRFFWYGENEKDLGRIAQLELRQGCVYYMDAYSGRSIYTMNKDWVGFTHGSTLRSLVEVMRDYVMRGTLIPRWKIAPERHGWNAWGYDIESAKSLREAAFALPIIETIDHVAPSIIATEEVFLDTVVHNQRKDRL